MIATDYAKALYGLGATTARLESMYKVLKRRGHEKLLPQILREYEKLELGAKRLEAHKKVTPERERTRVLFDMYKHLIA